MNTIISDECKEGKCSSSILSIFLFSFFISKKTIEYNYVEYVKMQ